MSEKKVIPFEEIRNKLAHYCAYQDRCHQEVEQKMREFMLIPEAQEELLLFLMKENYLNEERFTRSYIRGKFALKSWGKTKIKQHLKQKGISTKLIDTCMNEIHRDDYLERLQIVAHKYYDLQKSGNEFQKKNKTIRYLLSRGFEYDLIVEVLS